MSLYIYYICLSGSLLMINGREQHLNHITYNHLEEIEQTTLHTDKDISDKVEPADEKVSIRLYYECLCPFCIEFDINYFKPVVLKMNRYLDIKTYPYGNAMTFKRNGTYEFICQHGPKECYGNKLHACALGLMENKTEALLFNSCLMMPRNDSNGSDDVSVDECSERYDVSGKSIKDCAKGGKGVQLLKYYGDESKKAHVPYVPYILVNGKLSNEDNFIRDVCAAFTNPPSPCEDINT